MGWQACIEIQGLLTIPQPVIDRDQCSETQVHKETFQGSFKGVERIEIRGKRLLPEDDGSKPEVRAYCLELSRQLLLFEG